MKHITLIIMVIVGLNGYAQTNMVKGNKAIGFHYGLSKHSVGTYGGLDFQWMFKEKLLLSATVSYEFGKVQSTQFQIPSLSTGVMYNFFNYKNKFGCSVVGQGFVGLENGKSRYSSQKAYNKFLYGAKLGLETSLVTSERSAIKLNFTEWYARGSNVGSWFYTFSIGMIYNLN